MNTSLDSRRARSRQDSGIESETNRLQRDVD
jgi:uncharacterized protein with von Willebrand factor type A (vWA) domain